MRPFTCRKILAHSWIENVYHQRKHSGTCMTPFSRFSRNLTCIRQAPKNLKDHFRKAVYRTVAKDRTILLDGCLLEAPVVLIGKKKKTVLVMRPPCFDWRCLPSCTPFARNSYSKLEIAQKVLYNIFNLYGYSILDTGQGFGIKGYLPQKMRIPEHALHLK